MASPTASARPGTELRTWVNVVQLVLAVACAAAGFVAVRRARLAGSESV